MMAPCVVVLSCSFPSGGGRKSLRRPPSLRDFINSAGVWLMDRFKAYLVTNEPRISAAFADMDESQLDGGEVDVDVAYASINFKDALAATGRMPIIRRFPCIAGIDASGVVKASRSPRFEPGDRVIVHSHGFGVSHHGGYSPRARAPADWVTALPPDMTPL